MNENAHPASDPPSSGSSAPSASNAAAGHAPAGDPSDAQAKRLDALARAAEAWTDSDHPPRADAVATTLEAPNRFTEEALAYALNQFMARLSRNALSAWLGTAWRAPDASRTDASRTDASRTDASRTGAAGAPTVGVLHGAATPVDGLRDAVAVWGTGRPYCGSVPDASPALLPAFAEEVAAHAPALDAAFVSEDVLYERADALLAAPPRDTVEAIEAQCDAHGIGPDARLVHPPTYSVAVIDGQESDAQQEDLAEDVLLHEGLGRHRVAIVWAPRAMPPDDMLQAMAQFRGVFPTHADTPGALQMQQAFLEAQDASHAYGEGLEFLVSRGAPEVHAGAHLRWSEYDALDDVADWIAEHRASLHAVVAREGLHETLREAQREAARGADKDGEAPTDGVPLRAPGTVHRPPLDDADGRRTVRFLASLP